MIVLSGLSSNDDLVDSCILHNTHVDAPSRKRREKENGMAKRQAVPTTKFPLACWRGMGSCCGKLHAKILSRVRICSSFITLKLLKLHSTVVSLAPHVDFFIALRGEAQLAGLLFDYYQEGQRISEFGFNASYIALLPKLQWHFKDNHTFEAITNIRYWFFGERSNTTPNYILPTNTFVFEPRVGYIYWNAHSPGSEWSADKLFPRFVGVAAGTTAGLDMRSAHPQWGLSDGRNNPSSAIFTLNQWFRGGWSVNERIRIEAQEIANWGAGQDDITRLRVGGLNPYVTIIPGLPWAAILSSRLLITQASAHFQVKRNRPQELGLLVSGGTVNDPFRLGNLTNFGGIGGVAITTDLRFGIVQLYGRIGYAFPTNWLSTNRYFSALLGAGINAF